MHERVRRKEAFTENVIIVVMALAGLGAAMLMDRSGMPQRWHAAIVGTLIAFGGVALVYRRKWPFPAFWFAMGGCFGVHLLATWFVFARLLAPVQTLGILIWAPVAFCEGVLLLGIVPMLERRFRTKRSSQ